MDQLDNGHNLLYVDLWPDAALLAPEARRLPYDGHWSPVLHKIAAERIYKAIAASGLCGENTARGSK